MAEQTHIVPKNIDVVNSGDIGYSGWVDSITYGTTDNEVTFPTIKCYTSTYTPTQIRVKYIATTTTGGQTIGFGSSNSWRLFHYTSTYTYFDCGGSASGKRHQINSLKPNTLYDITITNSSIFNNNSGSYLYSGTMATISADMKTTTLSIGGGIKVYELDAFTLDTNKNKIYSLSCRPKKDADGNIGLYDSVNDTWYYGTNVSVEQRDLDKWDCVKEIDFGGANVLFKGNDLVESRNHPFANNPNIEIIKNVNIKNANTSSDSLGGSACALFKGCYNLKEFVGDFTNENATLFNAFSGCSKLERFISNNKPLSHNNTDMFYGCTSLREFVADLSKGSVNLSSCKKLGHYNYSGSNYCAGTAIYDLPKNGTTLDLSSCSGIGSADLSYMAYNTTSGSCTIIIPSSWLNDYIKQYPNIYAIAPNILLDKGYTISNYTRITTTADTHSYEVRDDTTDFDVIGYKDCNDYYKNVYYITHSTTHDKFNVTLTSGYVGSILNCSNRDVVVHCGTHDYQVPYNMNGSSRVFNVDYDYLLYKTDTTLKITSAISKNESNPTKIALVGTYSSYTSNLSAKTEIAQDGWLEIANYSIYEDTINVFGTSYTIPSESSITIHATYTPPKYATLKEGDVYTLSADDFNGNTIMTIVGNCSIKGASGLVEESTQPNITLEGCFIDCTVKLVNADGTYHDEANIFLGSKEWDAMFSGEKLNANGFFIYQP